MNIELAVRELTELQERNQLESLPALMAAYTTQYIREKSKAVHNLYKDNAIKAGPGAVVPISPTKIKRIEVLEEAPVLRICARPGFVITEGLVEARIINIFESMVVAIDRLFDLCVMHVLDSQAEGWTVDPTTDDYRKIIGYISLSDVINEVPEGFVQEAYKRFVPEGNTEKWFEFHLTLKLSMSVMRRF